MVDQVAVETYRTKQSSLQAEAESKGGTEASNFTFLLTF